MISDLYDFNNAYIVVKGKDTASADERDRGKMNRQVTCSIYFLHFKNKWCIC